MDFTRLVVPSVKECLDQSSLIRGCVLVFLSFLVACGSPETPGEGAESNTPTESVNSETVASTPAETTANQSEVESPPASPTQEPTAKTSQSVEIKEPTVEATLTPDASEEKTTAAAAPQTAVTFPEMKLPEEQSAVRELFIQANKQFNEERYVGAIQTLRKLDAMDLHKNEELALDMFLKRIEKALSDGVEPSDDAKKEETKE